MAENDNQNTNENSIDLTSGTSASPAVNDTPAQPSAVKPNASGNDFQPSKDTSDVIEANKGKLVILGVYLLLMIGLSVYVLGALMMAETDREKICAKLGNNTPCASSAATPAATPTPTATASPTVSPTPITVPVNINTPPGNTNGTNAGATKTPTPSSPTPTPTPSPTIPPKFESKPPPITVPSEVYISISFLIFSIAQIISGDSYVFLVVLFSGMLGGVIRSMYSFVGHLGLNNFAFNWIWFYITLPFSGAALAVVVYFVIRGGLFGGSFGKDLVLNLFAFAALGALTGLFTDQAMEKLKSIAETLLEPAAPKIANAREVVEKKESKKGNQ